MRYDILVIGSGPAGQKAAIQGAKAGKRVAVIEREPGVGGACVYRGTIPSKTLRESAVQLARMKRSADVFNWRLPAGLEVSHLMVRLAHVVRAHGSYMQDQLERNSVEHFHGRARFRSDRVIEMVRPDGTRRMFEADIIVIATGSRPRTPDGIPVDHEHVLDSDSILSMIYLPESLTVLGGGVIATEYASIFSHLGVAVTMVDRADRPLKFMDSEIVEKFVRSFECQGGRYCGLRQIAGVQWDGLSKVVTRLEDGEVIRTDKMLVALGRNANLEGLCVEAAGLAPSDKGILAADEYGRTAVPHIYAVGDMIGPPALASCAMEQGRRAICHALGLEPGSTPDLIPLGIYAIPEMASVGLSEQEAMSRHEGAIVGRAEFDEVARGQISGIRDGLLKLIADPRGESLLGVQIVGEGATELIHVGQMALLAKARVDIFIENTFNFPTLAEAYRVAALDIAAQRCRWRQVTQQPPAAVAATGS
jgi:NAD(P) transhydrogenase